MHLDGETPAEQRTDIINRFRKREILILSNVDLLGEGFDVPACDACIMLRPTQSLALYIQQSMRCMRYQPGKRAIIIDHVGNASRHGLPDDERSWTLEGKKKKKSVINATTCPNCFAVYIRRKLERVCPYCGYETQIKERTELEQVEGELEEVDPKNQSGITKKKNQKAKSYEDLLAIANDRGYKKAGHGIKPRLGG